MLLFTNLFPGTSFYRNNKLLEKLLEITFLLFPKIDLWMDSNQACKETDRTTLAQTEFCKLI